MCKYKYMLKICLLNLLEDSKFKYMFIKFKYMFIKNMPPLSIFRIVHNSPETNKFPVLYFQNEQITPPIKSNKIF